MSKELVVMPKADYKAACDSVRAKTGKTDLIKSGDLAAEIDSIEGGGATASLQPMKIITSNGLHYPDEGYDGFSSVMAMFSSNVKIEPKVITENGTYFAVDEGFEGYKNIEVNVPDYTADEDAIVGRGITRYVNPRVSTVGAQAFYGCSRLKLVHFANAAAAGSNSFRGCTSLATAIFDKADAINANAFNGCTALKVLILGTSGAITLGANTSLASTAIANGNGYVYVRPSLVEETRAGSYWSAYANQIMPLVSTSIELIMIDGATYNRACVWGGGEEYTEYQYNGTTWEVI